MESNMRNFNFIETEIPGVIIVETKSFGDNRGYFMETYQKEAFAEGGITADFVQDNQSKSVKGVLRGLHFQKAHPQAKLVRVLEGSVYDVAVDLRKELGYFSQATRLINSEGDALSGLIVDKYEDVLVMQATSLGILLRAEQFAQILQNLTGAKTVIATTEPAMARREGAPEELTADRVFGDPVPETMVIQSGGIKYEIQLLGGQKTGFYLDQRENRLAAAELFKGKTVLDMFCYHGGFSIAAAQAGAVSCLACDSSAKALEQVKKNALLNAVDNVETLQGDSFQILERFKSEGRTFGGVVLDPPKFAQGKRSVQEALRGYHYLNKLGISCVAPGGFLVTCSCTGSVRREDFFDMLHGAASQAGRRIQILQQRGAAPDHPVLDSCPESDYLKCFLCRVM